MGVGLQPLEFTECLADSPTFRENLQRHEKELERTSQQIKRLIKEVKDVVQAAKRLGAAQLALASSMEQFEFACIGASMTEDERVISRSLHHFAALIRTVEDERDRMLGRANEQIVQPLERFRKEHIGAVKETKKKFDKKTAKFCQTQERTLALSTKKPDAVFQEADAALDMAERDFCQASLEYAFQLQAVQERKKFELVETLLGFVFGWWTFHHTAHDVHADSTATVQDLQLRIQRTRSNFEETSKQTESLMKKMMEVRQLSKDEAGAGAGAGAGDEGAGGGSRAGYLFLMEKKAFGTAWSKQYASYERESRLLALTGYNQINVKSAGVSEAVCVCGARACAEHTERRFCWEAVPADRERPALTLQSLSEADRAGWLRALHAAPAPPGPHAPYAAPAARDEAEGEAPCALDDTGFEFVRRVIAELEARGLDEQGLYRVAGVSSKVSRLVGTSREAWRLPAVAALRDPLEWETKTLTSALKGFLRALPDPLLTRHLHHQFIAAAKLESRAERVPALRALVHALPARNLHMLRLVVAHLVRVSARRAHNLMSASNLAVCFGPTLLRAERDTVASILELKFYNVLVETLLDHCRDIFDDVDRPPASPPPATATALATAPAPATAHNGVVLRTSPSGAGGAGCARADLCAPGAERLSAVCLSVGGAGGGAGARYSPQHHQLLQHLSAHAHAPPPSYAPLASAPPLPPHTLLHLPGAGSSSSSAESVSSLGACPAPATRGACGAAGAGAGGATRVRTLYACLGESEGELSFEPNQILTNVAPSAEPGWLRGTLNGRTGLVPENYVEPLP